MSVDIATLHQFAEEPRKVGLLLPSDLSAPNPPVVIAALLELSDETIVIGTFQPDDMFRTTFDRFMGIAMDDGNLSRFVIAPSELGRIERFAAAGAYASKGEPPPQAPPTEVPLDEAPLDVESMMG